MRLSLACTLAYISLAHVEAFTGLHAHCIPSSALWQPTRTPLLRDTPLAATSYTTASSDGDVVSSIQAVVTTVDVDEDQAKQKKRELMATLRKEGGIFTFNTKYGALNPYGIYYGLTSILLGIPWFFALTACQFLYFITGGRFDRKRYLPVFCSQVWGTTLAILTRSWPTYENGDVIRRFFKEKRPAMMVANHASWMDIPFLGLMSGFRNYKFISKSELRKVPILGKAIQVGGNIMVDRTNRRSQIKTLKDGIQILKDGVFLCTFPEGTRSRTGKLQEFKNGAFKMAHKAGAPVIPITIVGSADVMPSHWMFPYRPARNVCKMIINEPVESNDKTEAELAAAVRKAMIHSLPEANRPDAE